MYNKPIIDAHNHLMNSNKGIKQFAKIKEVFGYERINILSLELMTNALQNPRMLVYKLHSPNDYIFGSLNHNISIPFMEQLKQMEMLGFDGIKMIEGKPDSRLKSDLPLNDKTYDDFYSYLEEKQIPLLLHVADPEEFWDEEKVPKWAKRAGWFWGDERYPKKEELYEEVDKVLEKFPNLVIILAHFYFLSADLERADKFLEKHPNVYFDITSGKEMYFNFSKRPEDYRNFFTKYQDRIIYGTDNVDIADPENSEDMNIFNNMQMDFLTTDKEFTAWGDKVIGINLDEGALDKILHDNFYKLVKEPKKVDKEQVIRYCQERLGKAEEYKLDKDMIKDLEELIFMTMEK